MKYLLILFASALLFGCAGHGSGEKPTKEDIEKAIRETWEKPASAMNGRTAVAIQSITIGSGDVANAQDVVDGVPQGAFVTIAEIDFTVREYSVTTTMATHRVMRAKVFKDQLNKWMVMDNGLKDMKITYE